MEESQKKTDFLGNEYYEHPDGSKSYKREDFLGHTYWEHGGGGKSYEREGFFGNKYLEHSDGSRSTNEKGFFGGSHLQHSDGSRSEPREGTLGGQYLRHSKSAKSWKGRKEPKRGRLSPTSSGGAGGSGGSGGSGRSGGLGGSWESGGSKDFGKYFDQQMSSSPQVGGIRRIFGIFLWIVAAVTVISMLFSRRQPENDGDENSKLRRLSPTSPGGAGGSRGSGRSRDFGTYFNQQMASSHPTSTTRKEDNGSIFGVFLLVFAAIAFVSVLFRKSE